MFGAGFKKIAVDADAPTPAPAGPPPAAPAPPAGPPPERPPQVPRPFIGSIGPGIIAGTAAGPVLPIWGKYIERRRKRRKKKKKKKH